MLHPAHAVTAERSVDEVFRYQRPFFPTFSLLDAMFNKLRGLKLDSRSAEVSHGQSR